MTCCSAGLLHSIQSGHILINRAPRVLIKPHLISNTQWFSRTKGRIKHLYLNLLNLCWQASKTVDYKQYNKLGGQMPFECY